MGLLKTQKYQSCYFLGLSRRWQVKKHTTEVDAVSKELAKTKIYEACQACSEMQ